MLFIISLVILCSFRQQTSPFSLLFILFIKQAKGKDWHGVCGGPLLTIVANTLVKLYRLPYSSRGHSILTVYLVLCFVIIFIWICVATQGSDHYKENLSIRGYTFKTPTGFYNDK